MGMERTVLEIGVLIYPGAQMAAVHGLTDLFSVAGRIADELSSSRLPRLRISHWGLGSEGELQRIYDSLPDAAPSSALAALLIPPSLGSLPDLPVRQYLANWIRQQHAAGSILGSVCLGGFLLAETGLLNGRDATTHWTSSQRFGEQFPAVKLLADMPIVDDGDLITTGGLMAWSALGLRLVERLLGPDVAAGTAHFLVVEHCNSARECGNNFAPIFSHGDQAVLKVQHWLQASGATEVSLAALAEHAGLGERTFLRRFRVATGLKPIQYCQHLRVGKARQMLEYTNDTVDHIAWLTGYRDLGWFRVTFNKITGLTPSEYRARFGLTGAAAEKRMASELSS